MKLIDAYALKADFVMGDNCNACLTDWRNCCINRVYTKMEICEWINAAPTVDAVPVVHGNWVDINAETYTWKIRCDQCGHERSMLSTGQTYPRFCEGCGAVMGTDGEQDENE